MELIRVEKTIQGVVSLLRNNGVVFCAALEPPDRDNQVGMSCIPAGSYTLKPVKSPRFGDTYEIAEVPGRSHILIHAGNTVADTQGCVLLGETISKLKGNRAVLNSGATFRKFLQMMDGKTAALDIMEV